MVGKVIGGAIVTTAVLAIWSHVALDGNVDPAALKTVTGCHAAPGQPRLSIAGAGTLRFDGQTVRVSGYRDKQGIALLPQDRITIDRHDHDRLESNPISPVLLRYDERSRSLEVPDFHLGRSIHFRHAACA